jgi:hypothetical protein
VISYHLNSVWSLCIKPQKKILQGLTPRELQAIVAGYDHNYIRDLFVWNESFSDWQPITNFPELLNFMGLNVPDKAPYFSFDKDEAGKESDPHNLKLILTRGIEDDLNKNDIQESMISSLSDISVELETHQHKPRKHERLNREFPVEIEANGKIFKTITKNISPGGMSIKDELPEWVIGYFSIKIFQPNINESLIHTGWAIETSIKRFHIAFLPFKHADGEEKFNHWLKAC